MIEEIDKRLVIVKIDDKYNVYYDLTIKKNNYKKEKPLARQPTLEGAEQFARTHSKYGYSILW